MHKSGFARICLTKYTKVCLLAIGTKRMSFIFTYFFRGLIIVLSIASLPDLYGSEAIMEKDTNAFLDLFNAS